MAIKDNNEQQKQSAQQPPVAQPTSAGATGIDKSMENFSFSQQQPKPRTENVKMAQQTGNSGIVSSTMKNRRNPFGRGAGESVQAYLETARKIVNRGLEGLSEQERDCWKLLVMDKMSHQTEMSAILLTYTVNPRKENSTTAVYQILIESTLGQLNPLMFQLGTSTIEIPVVASDVPNDIWTQKVIGSVKSSIGSIRVIDAGSMILHKELEADNEDAISRILRNATEALFLHLNLANVVTEEHLCIANRLDHETYAASVIYNPEPSYTFDGLPVRSDIKIITSARKVTPGGQQNKLNTDNQPVEFSRINLFVDFQYDDRVNMAYGQMPDTRRYYPTIVTTRVETADSPLTLESQLLSLSQVMLMSQMPGWIPVFVRRLRPEESLRDIGAFGYEIPGLTNPQAVGPAAQGVKGALVNTKSTKFDAVALAQLIQYAVHTDKTIYAIDVEESGDLTFASMVFSLAGEGDESANKALIQAADNLTGGAFSSIMHERNIQGLRWVNNDKNRIHLGYFIDARGDKRDLREPDYLTALTHFGATNLNYVVEWSRTFDSNSGSPEQRMASRWSMIQQMFPTAVLKGYARRFTFNPLALMILQSACVRCGFQVTANNAGQFTMGSNARQIGDLANRAFQMSNDYGTMFGYGQQQTIQNGIGGFGRTWNQRVYQ